MKCVYDVYGCIYFDSNISTLFDYLFMFGFYHVIHNNNFFVLIHTVKCDDKQCGVTSNINHGNCSGTTKTFTCKCNTGFKHPKDASGIDIWTKCEGDLIIDLLI